MGYFYKYSTYDNCSINNEGGDKWTYVVMILHFMWNHTILNLRGLWKIKNDIWIFQVLAKKMQRGFAEKPTDIRKWNSKIYLIQKKTGKEEQGTKQQAAKKKKKKGKYSKWQTYPITSITSGILMQ